MLQVLAPDCSPLSLLTFKDCLCRTAVFFPPPPSHASADVLPLNKFFMLF